MPMNNTSRLDYNIINEYINYLQNTGTCVIDNCICMYGEELKITREKIIDMCQDIIKNIIINGLLKMGFLQDV